VRCLHLLLLLCLGVATARAQPPGLTPARPAPVDPDDRYKARRQASGYRGTILAADGVALGLMLWSLQRERELDNGAGLVALSLTTYGLAAPGVHLIKGRSKEALASLALRVGLPLVIGAIGNELAGCDYDYDPTNGRCDDYDLGGWVKGAAVGAIIASAIDIGVLAKPDRTPAPAHVSPGWTPTVRSTTGGVALGVSGRF